MAWIQAHQSLPNHRKTSLCRSTEHSALLGEAVRDDDGKAPIHLIPPEVFTALAAVYAFGAQKYAPRNWERGMDWSRVYSSAMRHLLAFWSGEDDDEESGLPHVWHALWNCAALACYLGTHPERDDRPKCGT